ncbi:MAG TPA: ABC transporter substrate-binding protein [Thermoleophilaceae bacterium]|nr:ABC transporter substrate-binding protein [Thermoleophilaceae bacterium]
MRRILLVVAAAAALVAVPGCDLDDAQEYRMTLALDFQPNAVHAGIYAAMREVNDGDLLELDVRVPSSSTDSLKLLEAERADLAVVDIHDLGLARERGADLVGLGAVVQRPLAAVIARPEIRRPRDLEGKRVGVTGLPSDDALLRAVVEHDGGDFDRVERVTIGFSAVPSMIAGRVDAVVAFWNAEGVALRERGVAAREFRVDEYGAPAYPELVFVARRESLRQIGEELANLMVALKDGTRAALRDRAGAVEDVVEASGADTELVRAQFDAVAPALRPPVALDREALEEWAEFDARFGILERPPRVGEAFRVGFLGQ